MKDLVIKNSTLKKEIVIWLISLAIAIAINVYAIAKYDASWSELLSQIPVVILISVLIYLLLLIFRGIAKTLLKIIILFRK